MNFRFTIQQYQTDAVASVVDVFKGQPYSSGLQYLRDTGKAKQEYAGASQMTVTDYTHEIDENSFGYKNAPVELSPQQLLDNIRAVQSMRNIRLSDALVGNLGCCSLDVEMETGTGKTYVYTKTIFELHEKYGWSKFIVVVPSVAIREGVKQSFELTASHFMEHYHKKVRMFVYSSDNLRDLDDFSSSDGIQVMIINMQAFNSSFDEDKNNTATRIIFTARDSFASRRPIDVIAANRPIIIMDEPQKLGGKATQTALQRFNPLFMLNYSATHAKHHNLVYVLDALDAFNQRLVKRIEVKGFEVKHFRGTDGYVYPESIIVSPSKPPAVRMEIEILRQSSTKREFRILHVGDSLFYISNEMEQYKGISITDIDPVAGTVSFSNGAVVRKGDVVGDVSEKVLRRVQIRETIISHFEKEQQLFARGIKTLSLFFIDEVAKYRLYGEDGEELLGEYGAVFEEEYMSVLGNHRNNFDPAYLAYLDGIAVHDTHNGYFSIDKKTHRLIDSSIKRGTDVSDDVTAYELILQMKEKLLSFDEPTRFIFSHSALREGWDNPNVFQICTLKPGGDSGTLKRQEVGRGLRLCVDQNGTRMDADTLRDNVHSVNVLTVIASEGYADFVGALQTQTKAVLYDRPTVASIEYFTGKTVVADGVPVMLDSRQATKIYNYLIRNDYADDDGHIQDAYRDAAASGTLAALPADLVTMSESIHHLITSIFDESALAMMYEDGNATKLQSNPLNERFYKKEFQELWNAINHHYIYTVDFDTSELIAKAIAAIDAELYVDAFQYTVKKASQREHITAEQIQEGDSFGRVETKTALLKTTGSGAVTYDLIGKLAKGAKLTRRTAAAILSRIRADKFAMYAVNPEGFISQVTRLVTEQKATMVVEHITYDIAEGCYDNSIFTIGEQRRLLSEAFEASKAIQNYVFTDGTAAQSVERRFAESLDGAHEVFIFAKLPRGFQIPTPVGDYAPDWAIVFCEGAVKHVYFVAETKGTMSTIDLRDTESTKIRCTRKLFEQLSSGRVTFAHVDSYEKLLSIVS